MIRMPRKTGPVLIGLIIAAVAGAAYVSSLDNFFWNDDYWWLNHTRKTAEDPLLVFEDNMGCFRPLVNVYFALAFPVFGLSPHWYRVAAFAIHMANAALLGVVAHRLTRSRWGGYVAALVLAATWIHYEVVYWISAVTDLLALTFMLTAVVLYVRHLDQRSVAAYVGAVLVATASLLVKESAAALPLVLTLIHLLLTRKGLKRLLPFWGLSLLLLVLEVTLGIFARHGPKYGLGTHVFSNLVAYVRHVLLEPFAPWAWAGPIVASVALLPLVIVQRTRRLAVVGAAWLVIGLLPVSQWRFMEQVESRWCYLPVAGLSLWLAGWGVLLQGSALWKRLLGLAIAAAFCVHNAVSIHLVENLEHLRFAELQRRIITSMQSMVKPGTRRIVISHFPPIPIWQVDDISDLYFDGKLVKDDRFPIPEGSRVSSNEILVFTYAQERAVLR
jgi:hypothetical protein